MTQQNQHHSSKALYWASFISFLLVLLKAVAYGFTGSLLVMGSLFDSAGDAFVSAVNGRVQKAALAKPDREHPYGHGGFEVVSSLVQGTILSILGIVLIIQSADHLLFANADFLKLRNSTIGIVVLAFAAATGYLLQFMLGLQERKHAKTGQRSLSLKSDRAHYMSDFWVNGLSALGLLCVWATGIAKLDAVFGLVAGGFILKTAIPVLWSSLRDILHYEADPDIQQQIADIAKASDDRILSIHRLRARQYGPTIIADFHMKLPSKMSLEQAHAIGDQVVSELKKRIPHIDAIIHLDPDTEPDDDLW